MEKNTIFVQPEFPGQQTTAQKCIFPIVFQIPTVRIGMNPESAFGGVQTPILTILGRILGGNWGEIPPYL